MGSKFTTLLLLLGLAITAGTAGVLASSDDGGSKGADVAQYAPGKGCGDPNKPHSGPPGNPNNTDCPPQAGGPRTPDSENTASARRRATCAKRHPNSGRRRGLCAQRLTKLATCRSKTGAARKRCVKRADKIGRGRG
jgi:hypothetical protein